MSFLGSRFKEVVFIADSMVGLWFQVGKDLVKPILEVLSEESVGFVYDLECEGYYQLIRMIERVACKLTKNRKCCRLKFLVSLR